MKNKTLRKFLLTASLMSGMALGHSAWAENLIYHQGWPYQWLGKAEPEDGMGFAVAMGDFNNDGYADIAAGVSKEDVQVNGVDVIDSGAVNILYGSPTGPKQYDDSILTLSTFNAGYKTVAHQFFGSYGSLTTGDFNCDGYADLVIGVPAYGLNGSDRGAVFLIYGSNNGLNTQHTTSFGQEQISSSPREDGDRFGETLLAKDFTADGCDDLAIGVPYEDGAVKDVGVVHILYGHPSGLNHPSTLKSKLITQDDLSKGDGQKAFDEFGSSFASGDFNQDGYNDLAIGAPGEDGQLSSEKNVGYVHVLKGGPSGITVFGDKGYSQKDLTYGNSCSIGKWFGDELAAGNFDGKKGDDLLILTPTNSDLASCSDTGNLTQLKSQGASGLSISANTFFGYFYDIARSMAVGNFNGDGLDDVVFTEEQTGLFFELGHPTNGAFWLNEYSGFSDYDIKLPQDNFEFKYGSSESDQIPLVFASPLASGDINGDGLDDIVVGFPYQIIKVAEDPNGYMSGAIGVWLNPN